jgi:hypothetical protein
VKGTFGGRVFDGAFLLLLLLLLLLLHHHFYVFVETGSIDVSLLECSV